MLYRAKRKDNNEWIEGYYVCLNEKHHRIYTGHAEKDCGDYYPDWYEIDPETLCKYVYDSDDEGNALWEHDIVEVTDTNGQEEDTNIVEILFAAHGITPWSWEYDCDGCDLRYEIVSIKLLGNKFDNPNLIES